MSRKIRVGNDIDITWSLLDKESNPYNVEGRVFRIELLVGTKRVRISGATASENHIHFIYYGKDQKATGSVNMIYIENDGVVDMVTFDTKDAFTMVPHSWLAVDSDETPETVTLDVVTVVSELSTSVGPKGDPGPAAKVGDVTAEVDDSEGVPSVDVTTSGPDEQKNIHFSFHNLKGRQGERGLTGAVLWPEIYVDNDLHLHIVEPYLALGERLYVDNGKLYLRN